MLTAQMPSPAARTAIAPPTAPSGISAKVTSVEIAAPVMPAVSTGFVSPAAIRAQR